MGLCDGVFDALFSILFSPMILLRVRHSRFLSLILIFISPVDGRIWVKVNSGLNSDGGRSHIFLYMYLFLLFLLHFVMLSWGIRRMRFFSSVWL